MQESSAFTRVRICPKDQTQHVADAPTCSNCGHIFSDADSRLVPIPANFENMCPSCGAALGADAKFCANCGKAVPHQPTSAQQPSSIRYPYNPYQEALNPQPPQSAPQSNPYKPTPTQQAQSPTAPSPRSSSRSGFSGAGRSPYVPPTKSSSHNPNKLDWGALPSCLEGCTGALLELVFCVIVGIVCPPAIPVMVAVALILFFVKYWMD